MPAVLRSSQCGCRHVLWWVCHACVVFPLGFLPDGAHYLLDRLCRTSFSKVSTLIAADVCRGVHTLTHTLVYDDRQLRDALLLERWLNVFAQLFYFFFLPFSKTLHTFCHLSCCHKLRRRGEKWELFCVCMSRTAYSALCFPQAVCCWRSWRLILPAISGVLRPSHKQVREAWIALSCFIPHKKQVFL